MTDLSDREFKTPRYGYLIESLILRHSAIVIDTRTVAYLSSLYIGILIGDPIDFLAQ